MNSLSDHIASELNNIKMNVFKGIEGNLKRYLTSLKNSIKEDKKDARSIEEKIQDNKEEIMHIKTIHKNLLVVEKEIFRRLEEQQ